MSICILYLVSWPMKSFISMCCWYIIQNMLYISVSYIHGALIYSRCRRNRDTQRGLGLDLFPLVDWAGGRSSSLSDDAIRKPTIHNETLRRNTTSTLLNKYNNLSFILTYFFLIVHKFIFFRKRIDSHC